MSITLEFERCLHPPLVHLQSKEVAMGKEITGLRTAKWSNSVAATIATELRQVHQLRYGKSTIINTKARTSLYHTENAQTHSLQTHYKSHTGTHKHTHTKKESPEHIVQGTLRKRRRPPTLPHCIAVPSAQPGLTSLFGMGRGGTPAQ